MASLAHVGTIEIFHARKPEPISLNAARDALRSLERNDIRPVVVVTTGTAAIDASASHTSSGESTPRMIRPHAWLGGERTGHRIGVLVVSTHRVALVRKHGDILVQGDHRVDPFWGAFFSALLGHTLASVVGLQPEANPGHCRFASFMSSSL